MSKLHERCGKNMVNLKKNAKRRKTRNKIPKKFFQQKNKILKKFQKCGQNFFFGVLRKIFFFKKFCFKKHKN